MKQNVVTRREIIEWQIKRARAALGAVADDAILGAPAIAQWIAMPAGWSGAASAATVIKTVLALQAARVTNAVALTANGLSPNAVRIWRAAVASARARDRALDSACRAAVEALRDRVEQDAMGDAV